jgi:hypothetical protein
MKKRPTSARNKHVKKKKRPHAIAALCLQVQKRATNACKRDLLMLEIFFFGVVVAAVAI